MQRHVDGVGVAAVPVGGVGESECARRAHVATGAVLQDERSVLGQIVHKQPRRRPAPSGAPRGVVWMEDHSAPLDGERTVDAKEAYAAIAITGESAAPRARSPPPPQPPSSQRQKPPVRLQMPRPEHWLRQNAYGACPGRVLDVSSTSPVDGEHWLRQTPREAGRTAARRARRTSTSTGPPASRRAPPRTTPTLGSSRLISARSRGALRLAALPSRRAPPRLCPPPG